MSERRAIKFVRALVGGARASEQETGVFRIVGTNGGPSLDAPYVKKLASDGVLEFRKEVCRALPVAKNWLRRKISGADGPAIQHLQAVRQSDGTLINLNESPLARLAVSSGRTPPFLRAHHVQAGERFRKLVERAQMNQRTTMSYDPNRLPTRGKSANTGMDLNDAALDARRELHRIMGLLPSDCAGAVMDVCGFLKGLQLVETERQWPRRSAKLMLRVGLEQLAQHYGLSEVATGAPERGSHNWLGKGARPSRFE